MGNTVQTTMGSTNAVAVTTRREFGDGSDNPAIRVGEVVNDIRDDVIVTARYTKSVAQVTAPFYYAPYRVQIVSAKMICTLANASNDVTATIGTVAAPTLYGTGTLLSTAVAGDVVDVTLSANPVVPAGGMIVVNNDASVGAGSFIFVVQLRRLG